MSNELTVARVRELLDYDPETGVFRWRLRRPGRCKVGSIAGSLSKDYLRIRIGNKGHLAHRLAWLHVTGEWPAEQIDHINQDKLDNRFANLRAATGGQNQSNTKGWSSSGYKGVYRAYGENKWHAKIRRGGKLLSIGYFDDPAVAHKAYCDTASRIHGEFAHVGHRAGVAA